MYRENHKGLESTYMGFESYKISKIDLLFWIHPSCIGVPQFPMLSELLFYFFLRLVFKERNFWLFFLSNTHYSQLDIWKGSIFKWLYIDLLKPRHWPLIQEGAIFGENVLIFRMSGSKTLVWVRSTWKGCKTRIAELHSHSFWFSGSGKEVENLHSFFFFSSSLNIILLLFLIEV